MDNSKVGFYKTIEVESDIRKKIKYIYDTNLIVKLERVRKSKKFENSGNREIQDIINSFLIPPARDPDKIRTSSQNYAELKNLEIAKVGQQLKKIEVNIEDDKAELLELIKRLEDIDEKLVIYLRYFEDFKWKEIADVLHCGEDNIYKIRAKALKNMKNLQ